MQMAGQGEAACGQLQDTSADSLMVTERTNAMMGCRKNGKEK